VTALVSSPAGALSGDVRAPGDKSISHRALILAALCAGRTEIDGLLESADTLATGRAVAALGAHTERTGPGAWRVSGFGIGGLEPPGAVLDLGNSGTGARLLIGVLGAHPVEAVVSGDASLRRRPMARVMDPLERMGARFACTDARLPITVLGTAEAMPIDYRLPVPSAQVKSAVLLAGLNAPGRTSVVEPVATRDHTERMLRLFGAEVAVDEADDGARVVSIAGQPELAAPALSVPGDPSSAAFPLVAALIVPGSEITLRGVGVNPLRTGLYETLREMGADLAITETAGQCGEPVADITARASRLVGVTVPAARAARMIDEYPVLAVAAACAEGTTRLEGLAELRVKESDRLAAIAAGLAANGVAVEAGPDSLAITGRGGAPGGGMVATHMDHRIAMAFLVLGAAAKAPVAVDDATMIETSFAGFAAFMNGLGAQIAPR
jgi:3-phosphoshikimate 1-carboxyvinyltransferase